VTSLDINPQHNPDVVHDLNEHPLPFEDETFDEIHAYEVLEHLASQGDWRFFCSEWNEYYRILKAGGHFFGTVPDLESPWLWADPSHTRVITKDTLVFLNQDNYEQVGETAMSDFRSHYHGDFETMAAEVGNSRLLFVLRKK
jgi:predicted SAM-dependent methyltransferase